MNLLKKIKQQRINSLAIKQYKSFSKIDSKYDYESNFMDQIKSHDLNYIHAYLHHYFHQRCPKLLREHREYFKVEQRGFGEDAFHAMWLLLLLEYKPFRMLEIGVYRGQSITLWSLINKYLCRQHEVHGISPFLPVGDSVSKYLKNLDYLSDVEKSFKYWKLQKPILIKALSTDKQAIDHISSYSWDLIYIDGSHEFEIALADYRLCKNNLKSGGILVLDDASLGTDYQPPLFSFAGHPGPSRVAREYASKEMRFLCAVGHNNIYQKL